MKKIAVGLSGGVDSAAAAYLLKNQGFEVLGITLRLKPGSLADKDIEDAEKVAQAVGIPLEILDLRDYFRKNIIEPFGAEYLAGRTPNPCIECNKLIKFGAMLDFAKEKGCEKIATGHYASIECINGKYMLRKTDSSKDQSYFLFRLGQEQLSMIELPLAGMEKTEIRRLAKKAGISVADKKDSQEICFVPDDDYIAFLSSEGISSPCGNIIDTQGNILGRHNGITNYTVGQRKGLGAFGKPMFVISLNAENNTVTIGENGAQYSPGLTADRVSWAADAPREPFEADVKIRFRAKEQPALIIPCGNTFAVKFKEPQRSVTPGQSAVIYKDDYVIGGGRIITRSD
ncbi:MAG: tRNA 2-thiouridine(34) synthase MnmA [Clostridia bacterium]|nr:tRNA 2-thiouridine(34) synthase MnmA [Clostridia bacterium]